MKVPGIVEEGGLIRPLYSVKLPPVGNEVEIILPEVEIDEKEMARRQKVWESHEKHGRTDIRPLKVVDLVREDRESH